MQLIEQKLKFFIFGWTLVKLIFVMGHKLLETKHSVFHAVYNRKKVKIG